MNSRHRLRKLVAQNPAYRPSDRYFSDTMQSAISDTAKSGMAKSGMAS